MEKIEKTEIMAYRRYRKRFHWSPVTLGAVAIPSVLIWLFYQIRDWTAGMEWWVNGGLSLIVKLLRLFSSVFPFSVGEVLIVSSAVGLVAFLAYRVYSFVSGGGELFSEHHLMYGLTAGLWVWAMMCWLWNPLYYVPSFTEKSGLDVSPYPVEDLITVTTYFAEGAGRLSSFVPRNEAGSFSVEKRLYFDAALTLYSGLEEEFPFLEGKNVKAKSLMLSRVQSMFGFTGVYIPFTGEANVNVHTPAVFHPVTIAHEMAHQRLVAPELEANFLAVAACLESESMVFRYSGYLFGLIQTSNALYKVDPEAWQEIVDLYFSEELAFDWQENYNYWQSFQSPVEDVAKDVYDGFLKSNAQDLGIGSYGACVDLLVAYYREKAYEYVAYLEKLQARLGDDLSS